MAKHNQQRIDVENTDSTCSMAIDFDQIFAMVTLFLMDTPDRKLASNWLNALFLDGWEIIGSTNLNRLAYGKDCSHMIALDPATLTAFGFFGSTTAAHPAPSDPLRIGDLPILALQPAMERAVEDWQNAPDPVYLRTAWGMAKLDPVAYEAQLDDDFDTLTQAKPRKRKRKKLIRH